VERLIVKLVNVLLILIVMFVFLWLLTTIYLAAAEPVEKAGLAARAAMVTIATGHMKVILEFMLTELILGTGITHPIMLT